MMLHFILSRRTTNNTAEREDMELASSSAASADLIINSPPTLGSKRLLESGGGDSVESVRPKTARFELASDMLECDWNLPPHVANYIHKYMNTKISDKDIKEKILNKNPVPKNIKVVPELDRYMKDLLVENNKNNTLHIEKILKGSQKKMYLYLDHFPSYGQCQRENSKIFAMRRMTMRQKDQ